MPELSIVMPAFNEAATVGGVIRGHRDVASRVARDFEIIVCDDGSTDGTGAALAAAKGDVPELAVVTNERNLGIPATMRRLYGLARGEWIYFNAADGQVPASGLERMWAAREGAALVVGRRVPRRDPLGRVLIAEVYSTALRAAFRLPVHDIDSVKLYRAPTFIRSHSEPEQLLRGRDPDRHLPSRSHRARGRDRASPADRRSGEGRHAARGAARHLRARLVHAQ